VPDLVLIELGRALGEKLGLSTDTIQGMLKLLGELPVTSVPTPACAEPLSGDVADDRILAAVLQAEADVLVTGDRRHLLPLGAVQGMRILRPQEILAELAG